MFWHNYTSECLKSLRNETGASDGVFNANDMFSFLQAGIGVSRQITVVFGKLVIDFKADKK